MNEPLREYFFSYSPLGDGNSNVRQLDYAALDGSTLCLLL